MTMDHKTSHKVQFFQTEIYTSSESWINKLSIDVWFVKIWLDRIGRDTTIVKSEGTKKNWNIDKNAFKAV